MWKILHFLNKHAIKHSIHKNHIQIKEYIIDKKHDYYNLKLNNETLITEDTAESFCHVFWQHGYRKKLK